MKTRKGFLILRGKTFYAVWNVKGQRFVKTTGQTVRKDAEKELARLMQPLLIEDDAKLLEAVKARIDGGKTELAAIDVERNPSLTIAKAWDAYLSASNRPDTGESTLAQYAFQFDRFEAWMAEEHPEVKAMQEVTPDMAAEFAASMAKDGKSANTVNKYLNLLTLVFRVLKKPARLTLNPWEDVQRKRIKSQGRRELTIEELRAVCEAAQGEMRILLAIGIYTGLRLGDCATLRWGEVDLVRGIILRIPNKTGRRNPKPIQIPIHATLAAMLTEIPVKSRKVYVLPEIAEGYLSRSDSITDRVQRLFTDCGIVTHKPGTGFEVRVGDDGKSKRIDTGKRAVIEAGFHSLRHTFVSLCRAANAPLSVVESIVGHSNPAMTRHYTHTGIDAATAAVSALPSVMGGEIKALPPAHSPCLVDAGAVLAIVEGMNGKTWRAKRDELMRLARA
jgi:integrase